MSEKVLEIKDLHVAYRTDDEIVRAVNGLSLSIEAGETVGLVGETGAGKTTTALSIMKLLPSKIGTVDKGEILLDGENVLELGEKKMRLLRGSKVSMIFQDPMASLNERAKVDYIVSEGLTNIRHDLSHEEIEERVAKALLDVGLLPEFASRFPHEFSGGQRQRIGIARCLVMDPEFIIADEPISALDVSIRAQVLNLMSKLQQERGLTYLFIAHDLSVMRFICNRIAVIHKGVIVELAETEELFKHPLHPYTRVLLSAVPVPNPHVEQKKKVLVYDPSCHNYSANERPIWTEIAPGHFVRGSERELTAYREKLEKR